MKEFLVSSGQEDLILDMSSSSPISSSSSPLKQSEGNGSSSTPVVSDDEEQEKDQSKSGSDRRNVTSGAPQDMALYQLLVLVYRLRYSPAGKRFLSERSALTTVMTLLTSGTLRIQRIVIRLLRYMLEQEEICTVLCLDQTSAETTPSNAHSNTDTDTNTDNSASANGANDQKPLRFLARDLFHRIGELLSGVSEVDLSDESAPAAPNHEEVVGDSQQVDGGEAVGTASGLDLPRSNTSMIRSPSMVRSVSVEHLGRPKMFALKLHNPSSSSQSVQQFLDYVNTFCRDTILSSHKKSLRTQLTSADTAVILKADRAECVRHARTLARRGLNVSVVPQPPDDGMLRNEELALTNPSYWLSGYVSMTLVSELVDLIRGLATLPHWAPHLSAVVGDGVGRLAEMKKGNQASVDSGRSLAALAVLGGHQEKVRLGGRVRTAAEDDDSVTQLGTVVGFSRGNSDVKVVFDRERSATTVSVSQLVSVSTSYSASLFQSEKPLVIRSVVSFLESFDQVWEGDSASASTRRLGAQLRLAAMRCLSCVAEDQIVISSLDPSEVASLLRVLVTLARRNRPNRALSELEDRAHRVVERALDFCRPPIRAEVSLEHARPDHTLRTFKEVVKYLPTASALPSDAIGPTSLSEKLSRFVMWEDENRTKVVFLRQKPSPAGTGGNPNGGPAAVVGGQFGALSLGPQDYVITSEAPVPVSLRYFYFEVTLLSSNAVSVGLSPKLKKVSEAAVMQGIEQIHAERERNRFGRSLGLGGGGGLHAKDLIGLQSKGSVWSSDSYYYTGSTGGAVHCDSTGNHVAGEPLEPFATKGDVIGVFWDIQASSISFTKNGMLFPVSWASVSGRQLYPAIGFTDTGTEVSVNFGQKPFKYSLPTLEERVETEEEKKDRLERAAELEKQRLKEEEEEKARQEAARVAQEVERKEMAMQLMSICGGMLQSEKQALKALEMNDDKLEVTVTWILDDHNAINEINREVQAEEAVTQASKNAKAALEKKEADDAAASEEKKDGGKAGSGDTAGDGDNSTEDGSKAQSTSLKDLAFNAAYSSQMALDDGLAPPPDEDNMLNQVDPAEEAWLDEIEGILRHEHVDPSQLRAVMGQLRQGGQARANALLMLPDLGCSIPQNPNMKARADNSLSDAAHSKPLRLADAKVGLRVRLEAQPPKYELAGASSAKVVAAAASLAAKREKSNDLNGVNSVNNNKARLAEPIWVTPMVHVLGRSGIVSAVDSKSGLVCVVFDDEETSSVSEWWVKPSSLYPVDKDLSDGYIGLATKEEVECDQNLVLLASVSSLYARRAILQIISNSASLSLPAPATAAVEEAAVEVDQGGSTKTGITFLHEDGSTPAATSTSTSTSIPTPTLTLTPTGAKGQEGGSSVTALKTFLELAAAEYLSSSDQMNCDFVHPLLSMPPVMQSVVSRALGDEPDLLSALLQDASSTIQSSTQSFSTRTDPRRFEGLMNVSGSGNEAGACVSLCVDDASAVVITFRNESNLPEGIELQFFGDAACTRRLKRFAGDRKKGSYNCAYTLRPFVLQTNEFWFRVEIDKSAQGSFNTLPVVAFEATPLPDQLMLSNWILDFLIVRLIELSSGDVSERNGRRKKKRGNAEEKEVEVKENNDSVPTQSIVAGLGDGVTSDAFSLVRLIKEATLTYIHFLRTPSLAPALRSTVYHLLSRALRCLSLPPVLGLVGLDGPAALPTIRKTDVANLLSEASLLRKLVREKEPVNVYLQSLIELLVVMRSVYGDTFFESALSSISEGDGSAEKAVNKSPQKSSDKKEDEVKTSSDPALQTPPSSDRAGDGRLLSSGLGVSSPRVAPSFSFGSAASEAQASFNFGGPGSDIMSISSSGVSSAPPAARVSEFALLSPNDGPNSNEGFAPIQDVSANELAAFQSSLSAAMAHEAASASAAAVAAAEAVNPDELAQLEGMGFSSSQSRRALLRYPFEEALNALLMGEVSDVDDNDDDMRDVDAEEEVEDEEDEEVAVEDGNEFPEEFEELAAAVAEAEEEWNESSSLIDLGGGHSNIIEVGGPPQSSPGGDFNDKDHNMLHVVPGTTVSSNNDIPSTSTPTTTGGDEADEKEKEEKRAESEDNIEFRHICSLDWKWLDDHFIAYQIVQCRSFGVSLPESVVRHAFKWFDCEATKVEKMKKKPSEEKVEGDEKKKTSQDISNSESIHPVVSASKENVEEAVRENSLFTVSTDKQVTSLLNAVDDMFGGGAASANLTSRLSSLNVDKDMLVDLQLETAFPSLAALDTAALLRRTIVWRYVNLCLSSSLPYVDLSLTESLFFADEPLLSRVTDTFACGIAKCRSLLMDAVRNSFMAQVISLTAVESKRSARVVVDRILAASAREGVELGEKNFNVLKNCEFGQAFNQLSRVHPLLLRPPRPHGANPHISFEVKFRGEHAVGEGGPYRQFFSDACRELTEVHGDAVGGGGSATTQTLPLLVQCANQQVGVGDNRDKFVPRPCSDSPNELAMFEFLGRLMGIAVRTNILMPLDLPSFFWKQVVGTPVSRVDLEGIDKPFKSGVLDNIYQCKSEADFDAAFGDSLTFSVTLSDRTVMDLKPNGRSIPVTFESRLEYAALAEEARLSESHVQIKSIRRGLCQIIPSQLLSLCSWDVFETRVCGKPVIDIDLLKRHTEYRGVKPDAEHIQHFWRVLEEFSQEDRRKFIKFAWAQERLPSTDEEFQQGGHSIRMLIKGRMMSDGQNPDEWFPRADTCFFNLELPPYSSFEVMKEKLSIVILLSGGMDGDDQADVESDFGHLSDGDDSDSYLSGEEDEEEDEDENEDEDDEEEEEDSEDDLEDDEEDLDIEEELVLDGDHSLDY